MARQPLLHHASRARSAASVGLNGADDEFQPNPGRPGLSRPPRSLIQRHAEHLALQIEQSHLHGRPGEAVAEGGPFQAAA